MLAKQLWFTAPGQIEIREQDLTAPKYDQVLVKSLYSAISTGTEMLVYRGQLPAELSLDSSIDELKDQIGTYPLTYGYATVGTILDTGPDIDDSYIGKNIFAFVPHASHSLISFKQIYILPKNMDPEDAVFLANMETAVNLVQDGNPLLGEKVSIFGLGIVGMLTSCILDKFPLSNLYALELIESRRRLVSEYLNVCAFSPDDKNKIIDIRGQDAQDSGVDLCYELTGNPEAIDLAIKLCGYNGRIVVGSWYGNKRSTIDLGGEFHRNRIKIISSQVSTISPELSGRWDKIRRLEFACKMISEVNPGKFTSKKIAFEQAPQAYELLDSSPQDYLQILLKY